MEDFAAILLETGGLKSQNIEAIQARKNVLLDELKDDGLVLAEGMGWDDHHLASAIGSSDKEPYETLYSWAKQMGSLNQFVNQTHPSSIEYQLKVSRSKEQSL